MGGMKISVSLPDGLVEVVDGARGDVPRSTWIRRQIESSGYRDSSEQDRVKAEREAKARDLIRAYEDAPSKAPRSPGVEPKSKVSREVPDEIPLPKIAPRGGWS